MDLGLRDKVALVTGGASGIGRATALFFADEGARVAVLDIQTASGEDTVRRIEAKGGEAAFFACDVSRDAQVREAMAAVVGRFGGLDCAFNGAGIEGITAPVADYDEDAFDRIVEINLKGVWLCMKYEIPEMLKRGGGSIVNAASAAALVAIPGASGYTAAKHGVLGLTKSAALEHAKSGVRINAVCPGVVHTEMIDRVIKHAPHMEKFYADSEPIGRMGRVDEIAGAVVWLCSPWASFMIGSGVVIDGGVTLP
jgi:NAD(P)-dependent dehydrogenase (short-subunit alcohol dehydrogenase family)